MEFKRKLSLFISSYSRIPIGEKQTNKNTKNSINKNIATTIFVLVNIIVLRYNITISGLMLLMEERMAKASNVWKLIVLSVVISLVVLAVFTAVFITMIVPAYNITRDQVYTVLSRVLPILIGLVLVEIGLLIGKKSDPETTDTIDKLTPNSYDAMLYTKPVDDPMPQSNIIPDVAFGISGEKQVQVKEVIKEVPVEIVKEVIKEVPVEVPAASETIVREIEKPIEIKVPVEVIKEVQVPIEVVKEVQVPVEIKKEVPVEVVKEIVKEVPVEVVREVEKEVPVEVIKEVIKEVPVEVIKEIIKEVPVEVIKEVPVEVIKEVEREVPVEVIKEVPVEVIKEVEKEVPVEVVKEIPVEIEKASSEESVDDVLYDFRSALQLELDIANEEQYPLSLVAFAPDAQIETKIQRTLGSDTPYFTEDGITYVILPFYSEQDATLATRLIGNKRIATQSGRKQTAESMIRQASRGLA